MANTNDIPTQDDFEMVQIFYLPEKRLLSRLAQLVFKPHKLQDIWVLLFNC